MNPSCLQTTRASLLSQLSSQTVPQYPPEQYSTLPWFASPPINLTAPAVLHVSEYNDQHSIISPATSLCVQQVLLTCTADTGIFTVATIVNIESITWAGQQCCLTASTSYIIQHNRTSSLTKGSTSMSYRSCTINYINICNGGHQLHYLSDSGHQLHILH